MANEVEVKITASTDALSDGMNEATSKVQSAAADINRIAETIKNAFDGVRDSLKNIDISLNIDMSGINQRLNTATNTIKNRINAIADDAAIKLKIDTASLNTEIGQAENLIRSRLSSLPIQNVSLNIDVNEIRRKLNQLNSQQVKVKLGLDLSTLQAQMQQARTTITSTFQSTLARAIQITVNLPLLTAQLARARALINTTLNQLRHSNININTIINIDATSGLLRGSLDRLKTSIDLLRTRINLGGGSGGGGSGGGGGGSGGGSGIGLGTSIAGNFLANMASELVTQIGALTGEVIRNAREIENMSRLANATTQEFQEWAFASNSVGISQEKLGDIMKDVNDKFGEFMLTGGGEMADFFDKIAPKVGLTAKEFQGLSGPQVLGKYYEALQKAGLSQAEITTRMEALANDSTLLSPLLENNAAKLKELSKQAHELGVILDADAIQATKEFDNSLNLISATIKGVVGRAVAELAPTLKGMADNFLSSATKSKDAIDGSIGAIVTILGSLGGIVSDVFTLIGDIWKDLTSDIGDSSIQQIGFMDLVSGALKGFAAAAVGLRVGIQIAFAAIRAVVAIVCQAINLAVNTVINVFGGFRATIQYGLDVLSIKFQTFGSVVSNVLNFNFSGAKAAWEGGLSQLGATTDRYTKQMQSRLTNLKTGWQNSALGVTTAVTTLGQSIVDSATKGGGKFSDLYLGSPKGSGSTNPPPSPTFDPNRGIGTGIKDASGGSAKSKADADAKAKERAALQLSEAIANIRYKYASEEEKIASDLKKALDEIEKSKVSDAEKVKFKVVAEKEASDKRIALSVEEFEKVKVIREADIENKLLIAQRSFEIDKANIQAAFDAKKISNVEKIQLEKALEDQLREIKRRGLQERLDLENQMSGKSGKQGNQNQILNSISDLDTDQKVSDTQMTGLMSDAQMQDFESKFGDLTSRMSGLWDKGIQSMMDGTLTWRNATNAVLTDMAGFAISLATKELQNWMKIQAIKLAKHLGIIGTTTAVTVSGEAAQTGAVIAGETARTAATTAGGLARMGAKVMETIKSVMLSAYEAMAGAWAALSSIPYVGPALGVAAGIAAFAGVSAIVGKVASAQGGYDIPAGVNPMTQLHEEEMVLPKQHANTIRALGKSMTGDGSIPVSQASGVGGGEINNFNFQSWDSKDIKRFMKKHGRELAGGLRGYNRNFGK